MIGLLNQFDQEVIASNFVGGCYSAPVKGEYLRLRLSRREVVTFLVPLSCAADVDQALHAAQHSLSTWSEYTRMQRIEYLRDAVHWLQADRKRFTRMELWDFSTKTKDVAARSVDAVVAVLRHPTDQSLGVPNADRFLVPLNQQPAEVTKLLIPSDVELARVAERIAPLLAAGHTLVIGVLYKLHASPSNRVVNMLALIAESLPTGALNVLCGTAHGMGSVLINDARAVTTPLLPLPAGSGVQHRNHAPGNRH